MFKLIVDFFKVIYHDLTREKTRLEIDIDRHERAAERHRKQLDIWNNNFNPKNDCCRDCMTGGADSALRDRLERCEINLERMRKKQRSIDKRQSKYFY